ncbi:MAG TPA: pyridoxal 5'-phosphate synthase glutaminase subunit PdxT [Syntrophales bacterium]|nr:pyridoxal 5'-phosphate synthase glutaminase subunit PdxT [Syntrophales bacterium]
MATVKALRTGGRHAAIGVLDLQGGVVEHLDHLSRLGLCGIPVKKEEDFAGLAGLIIPGGESTCLARLLRIFGLREVILREAARGMKIWGTCAGAILLAREVVGEEPFFDLIDIRLERNSFGSQLDSFRTEAKVPRVSPEPLPLTFIRAPKILSAGPDVRVLLAMDGYIAAAENDSVLVTVFHPELTGCLAFHRYFALKCGLSPAARTRSPMDSTWDMRSWTRRAPRVIRG